MGKEAPEICCKTGAFLYVRARNGPGEQLEIHPLDGYFKEQFQINDSEESLEFWQVFDRTENREISKEQWSYCRQSGAVTITGTEEFHQYTVNFLAPDLGKKSICTTM